ncbi:MAG TPA: glycerol-3-phosphate 1-O-acyltransferase PlsY [Terriglobales bacterium]
MTPMSVYLITVVASYLLGTIPFGYLLVRVFRREDVRSSGSGNIGATNVARTSPVLGVVTLVLDAGKGLAAVILARALSGGEHQRLVMTIAAFCAIVGHLFPVWLNFRGGKGVATSLGSFALIAPKSIVCMVGLFLLIVAATRYISMGSVLSAAAFPVLTWVLHESVEPVQLILIALASLLVVWKHRQNIGRLVAGTESKFGAKRG